MQSGVDIRRRRGRTSDPNPDPKPFVRRFAHLSDCPCSYTRLSCVTTEVAQAYNGITIGRPNAQDVREHKSLMAGAPQSQPYGGEGERPLLYCAGVESTLFCMQVRAGIVIRGEDEAMEIPHRRIDKGFICRQVFTLLQPINASPCATLAALVGKVSTVIHCTPKGMALRDLRSVLGTGKLRWYLLPPGAVGGR